MSCRHTHRVNVELIALTELDQVELGRWRELAAQAVEPNPFFEPEYVLPLARGLGQENEVQILAVRDSGEWRACLPVRLGRHWHRIPLRSTSSWRGHLLYGLLGTPLVTPDGTEETLAALVDGMLRRSNHATFATLEWVAEDGPLATPLAGLLERRSPAPVCFERFERAVLRRRPEPTYVEETLSSKHRRELRRQRRKLGEELGEEPTMVDRAGEDAAYEAFMAMEAAGQKGTRGTVMAADPCHASFFMEMCRGFAAQGRLQLLELQGSGQTAAAKCNLIAGDTIFFFKIAYDEKLSSLSPGILLELEMLKFFHDESEANLMDSCADTNNAMINRLWPDRRSLATYALPVSGIRGHAARPALVSAKSLRDRHIDRSNA
jgi:CelD/BcsL family acetyltransferase involved in cellulose biosynthesis